MMEMLIMCQFCTSRYGYWIGMVHFCSLSFWPFSFVQIHVLDFHSLNSFQVLWSHCHAFCILHSGPQVRVFQEFCNFSLPFATWFSPVGFSTCPWDHFSLWLPRVNQQPQHTMSDGHCVDRRCFSIGFWFPSSLWLLAHLFLFFATYLEITH